MHISFSGSRDGYNAWQAKQLEDFLRQNRDRIRSASHGSCRGADIQFHELIRRVCGKLVYIAVYPSTAATAAPIPRDANFVAAPRPPLTRNPDIINAGKDLLLLTPKEMSEVQRSGTWSSYRYAKRHGIPFQIFWSQDVRLSKETPRG